MTDGRRCRITVPLVDVAQIYAETSLSQSAFVQWIDVAKEALLNWEQGRRLGWRQQRLIALHRGPNGAGNAAYPRQARVSLIAVQWAQIRYR
jgi:hypothetical protein